jgi:hypothetical protein
MSRNPKRFVLACVLGLTALALTAPTGQAADFKFETAGHRTITGSATGNFTTTAGGNTLTCKKLTWHKTIETGIIWDTILEETLTYSECTNAGVATTVTTNGCSFNVDSDGEVGIQCPAGKAITYKSTVLGVSCEIQIGPQTGLKSVSFTNTGSGTGREVKQSLNLTGIAYTATGGLCSETGSKTNGKMTGEGVMKATSGGLPSGMWWE